MNALRTSLLVSLALLAACSRQETDSGLANTYDYPSQNTVSTALFAFDNPGKNADRDFDDVRIAVSRQGIKGPGRLAYDVPTQRLYAEGGDLEAEFLVTEEFGSCSAEIQMYTTGPNGAGGSLLRARGNSKELKNNKGSLKVLIPAGHSVAAWVFVQNGVNPVMNCATGRWFRSGEAEFKIETTK